MTRGICGMTRMPCSECNPGACSFEIKKKSRMTYEEAIKEFEPFIDHEAYTDSFQEVCKMAIEAFKKVAALEKRGFTDEVLDNYKTFEDECIAKGFTFKSLIEARERQIPKKPAYQINGLDKSYKCPICGTFAIDEYCIHCGQKINWSEGEDEV